MNIHLYVCLLYTSTFEYKNFTLSVFLTAQLGQTHLNALYDTSHIPIILLTALSERENIIFGLEAGANDYIIKPFDLSVLKAVSYTHLE